MTLDFALCIYPNVKLILDHYQGIYYLFINTLRHLGSKNTLKLQFRKKMKVARRQINKCNKGGSEHFSDAI